MRRLSLALFLAPMLLAQPAVARAQVTSAHPHGVLPEGLSCTDCHTTTAWTSLRPDPTWSHDDTGFQLDGRHAEATCALCHAGLVFDAIETGVDECATCHVDVHQGSMMSPCSSCHGTTSFTDLDPGIVHPAAFPLEGAHLQVSCESCHQNDIGGAYRPLDRECATCHYDDYLSSDLVDHAALGFSTDCTECHSTLDFRDVAFDHFGISRGFELTGAHRSVECTSCHSGTGSSVPEAPVESVDCYACHVDDYQQEHTGSGFPTDCLASHNDLTWDDATFDHLTVSGGFELTGAHQTIECARCHSGPDGSVPETPVESVDCYACHVDDYEREHAGTGFATDCLACHNDLTWEGATFEHTFSIFSGRHAQEWDQCEDCHTTPGDFSQFSCFACHTRSDTDDRHTEEPGYLYDSPTCIGCHPTGND